MWNEFDPPAAEAEVGKIKAGDWMPPKLHKYTLHSVTDIIAWPPPEWLVPGYIVTDATNVHFGQAGCFKTFLA